FFFQAEDGIRDRTVTGVQTCALPISASSHRALSQGAALLRARWADAAPYRLFVQGEAPRERLLQEFRADGNGVLLGTASFWEGEIGRASCRERVESGVGGRA